MAIEPQQPYDFDFAPTSIPQDILIALGLISASWASLEDAIEQAIAGFAGIDVLRSAALFTHATMPLRLDQMKTLASLIMMPEIFAEFEKIHDEIKECQKKRNTALHNAIFVERKTRHVFQHRRSARGTLKSSNVVITSGNLVNDAATINDVALKLHQFLCRYNLLPSLTPRMKE